MLITCRSLSAHNEKKPSAALRFGKGKGRIARGTTSDSAGKCRLSWACNGAWAEGTTGKPVLRLLSSAFASGPPSSVCSLSSEATFHHALPGPPFSRWAALSAGFLRCTPLPHHFLLVSISLNHYIWDWRVCQVVFVGMQRPPSAMAIHRSFSRSTSTKHSCRFSGSSL